MPPSPLQIALSRRLRPLVVDKAFLNNKASLEHCRRTSSRIPLTLLQQSSLDDFAGNEPPGAIALLRGGDENGPLIGLGFYDPNSVAVEVFEWGRSDASDVCASGGIDIPASVTSSSAVCADEVPADIVAAMGGGRNTVSTSSVSSIPSLSDGELPPVPDVRYFHGKLITAFRKRTSARGHRKGVREGMMAVPTTNARRLFNGAADGIPSLYIDQYGGTAHIFVTSFSASQLIPLVEILLMRVLELRRVYHFTPDAIHYGVREGATATAANLENSFYEDGMVYYAPTEQLNPSINTITDVLQSTFSYAFHPLQHAGSRRWLVKNSNGKRVALLGDEVASIGSALSAATSATKVYFTYAKERSAKRLRAQFGANFNDTIFNSRVETVRSGELSFPLAKQHSPHIVVSSGIALSGSSFIDDAIFACDYLLEGRSYENDEEGRVGHLVLMCGSNALGLPRVSSGGLIPSAEDIVFQTISVLKARYDNGDSENAGWSSTSDYSFPPAINTSAKIGGRRIVIKEVSMMSSSEGFPHNQSAEARGLVEGWGPAFCDVILEVKIED